MESGRGQVRGEGVSHVTWWSLQGSQQPQPQCSLVTMASTHQLGRGKRHRSSLSCLHLGLSFQVRRARGRRKQQPTRPYQWQHRQQQRSQQQQQQQQNSYAHYNISLRKRLEQRGEWRQQRWGCGRGATPPSRGHLQLGVVAPRPPRGVGSVPRPPLGAAPCTRHQSIVCSRVWKLRIF